MMQEYEISLLSWVVLKLLAGTVVITIKRSRGPDDFVWRAGFSPSSKIISAFLLQVAHYSAFLQVQCISTKSIARAGRIYLKCLSQVHNNVTIMRFELTIVVAINGDLSDRTA